MTWYAYTTVANKETDLSSTLEDLGFGVALPMETVKRLRPRSRRRVDIKRPLIRGYIFVDIPGDLGWWHILHVRHIRGIVGMSGRPVQIDPEWIDRVTQDKSPSRIGLAPGCKVEVVGGPATGHLAKVVEAKGDFATLLFETASFPGKVSVRVEHLEQIG